MDEELLPVAMRCASPIAGGVSGLHGADEGGVLEATLAFLEEYDFDHHHHHHHEAMAPTTTISDLSLKVPDDDDDHARMLFPMEPQEDDEPPTITSSPASASVATTTTPSSPSPSPSPTSASSTSATAATAVAAGNDKPRRRRRRAREQLPGVVAQEMSMKTMPPKSKKEELDCLREEVRKLEEKLRLLRKSSRAHREPDDPLELARTKHSGARGNGTPSRKPARPQGLTTMWENLALRQYQQRQRSEIENLRLKGMLEDQLKLAKSLERMLKRSTCNVLTPNHPAKRVRRLDDPDVAPDDDAEVFQQLSSTIGDMYGRVGEAFSDPRFVSTDADFRDVRVEQDPTSGTSVEVLISKRLPFGVHETANAIWNYFVDESMDSQGFHLERDVERTDDTVMKCLRVELQIKRYFGRFRGKIVGRRYIEADRVVIVWATMVEPMEVSETPMDGITMRQMGWTVVTRQGTPGDGAVALVQSKHVAVPDVYEEIPDFRRKVELLVNYVLYLMYTHIESSQETIENLLIQEMIKSPSPLAA